MDERKKAKVKGRKGEEQIENGKKEKGKEKRKGTKRQKQRG
jgi:hypothetical protein